MGSTQQKQEVIESLEPGAQGTYEVTRAAIQQGDRDCEEPIGWAADASKGLSGAAVTDAHQACTVGFEHQAVSLDAECAKNGASLAAYRGREPGSPHPDASLDARG